MDRLLALKHCGQAIWLDFISRSSLVNKEIEHLIKHDHITGLTSNPSIFLKAIAHSHDYDSDIARLKHIHNHDAHDIYEALAIEDVKEACDLLALVYEESQGNDGLVSIEVPPHLVFNAESTIAYAQRLYDKIEKPNIMIKVPGSKEGFIATRKLIAQGINVNITLLFAIDAYKEAAMAYILGQQDRVNNGLALDRVKSVASFFISRIDTKIDHKLLDIINHSHDQSIINTAKALLGKTAILNAKLAYLAYKHIYESDMAKSLLKKGLAPQKLLWASTSSKNKLYPDVMYVEALIAEHTINTMPLETIKAFKDHGQALKGSLDSHSDAHNFIDKLHSLGINFPQCLAELFSEGIKLFTDAHNDLILAIARRIT